MSEWISVEERLPKEGREVLWLYETGEYTLYARREDEEIVGVHEPKITHWMPLPPPPMSNPIKSREERMGALIRNEFLWKGITHERQEGLPPTLTLTWKTLQRLLRQAFMIGSKGHNTWEEFLIHCTGKNVYQYRLPNEEVENG